MKNSVDVIIPFHRHDEMLERSIASVSQAIEVEINIILVDDRTNREDFSPYSTVKTRSHGYENAVNSALPHLKSNFVALMNSDDLIFPERFIQQITLIKETGKSICISRMRKTTPRRIPQFMLGGNPRLKNIYPDLFLVSAHYSNATWCATRGFWEKNVLFESEGVGSDWLLGSKILSDQNTCILLRPTYLYIQHELQITKNIKKLSNKVTSNWAQLNLELNYPPLPPEIGIKLVFPAKISGMVENLSEKTIVDLSEWLYIFCKRNPQLKKVAISRVLGLLYEEKRYLETIKNKTYLLTLIELLSKQAINKLAAF